MLYVWYALIYLIVGCVVIAVVSVKHVMTAAEKGNDWETIAAVQRKVNHELDHAVVRFIFGLLIWPVRIAQYLRYQDAYFELYESIHS